MGRCEFVLKGGDTSLLHKGDQTTWKMDPPNAHPCTVSCSVDGDLEVSVCGGDGTVVIKAKADNAKGRLIVTQSCPADETQRACSHYEQVDIGAPLVPDWTLKAKFTQLYAILSGILGIAGLVLGTVFGGAVGVVVGWFGGIALGLGLAWLIEKILDP